MSAVVGVGLVSPRGLNATEHVFVLRAAIRVGLPSPFVDRNEEAVRVAFCPWLGARMPLGERLTELAKTALADALAPLAPLVAAFGRGELEVIVCAPEPRPELLREDIAAALSAAAIGAPDGAAVSLTSAGGAFFAALGAARERLGSGKVRASVVLGVDSLVSAESVARAVAAPSPWAKQPPRPSEAAAALALMDEGVARSAGVTALARVVTSATRLGEARDDNDVPTDGAAMTALLRELPPLEGPIVGVYGQNGVDSLRESDWHYAATRQHTRFYEAHERTSLENQLGRVGAAAGAVNAACAVAAARHRTLGVRDVRGPLLAWALSPDGTRGLCALSAAGSPARPSTRGAADA